MEPTWHRIDDPAGYVRKVLGVEAPDIPESLLSLYDWGQAILSLDQLRPDRAMLEEHDRDPVHIGRRDGFVLRIRAGESLPPLIALGVELRLVDGYSRFRALRLLGHTEAAVLRQLVTDPSPPMASPWATAVRWSSRHAARKEHRMAEPREWTYDGFDGTRVARTWDKDEPRYIALLCHGYGEHIGRYEYVAATLVGHGAVVHGVDHVGHGKSDGDRVVIEDYERVVDDFHQLHTSAVEQHPELPVVLIGHSMGGLIAARYAQRYGESLAALVLSGPVLGRWDIVPETLAQDPIPYNPIDIATLSRDMAIGKAYDADPLVWHGPFKRPLLEALQTCLDTINAAGSVGALPTLWLHGEDDQLVPIDGTSEGIERLRGTRFESKTYPGARHEIFNETTKREILGDVTSFVDWTLGSRS